MCEGERLSMLTWGSTAAHCQKFKHGKGLMYLLKKMYKVEYERLKLLQELADLEEQVKEDEEDKKESKSILKKCTDRLKNQENLVWKLKEKSVLEQKECEDKKKVASKETLDALKVCFASPTFYFSPAHTHTHTHSHIPRPQRNRCKNANDR